MIFILWWGELPREDGSKKGYIKQPPRAFGTTIVVS